MNKQTEIKESTVLLMPDGNLARPGYCKHNLFRYNPEMIKRENTMRLKEWDYYQISDGNIMIQLNFFNISLATCATFGLVNLKTGRKISGTGVAARLLLDNGFVVFDENDIGVANLFYTHAEHGHTE